MKKILPHAITIAVIGSLLIVTSAMAFPAEEVVSVPEPSTMLLFGTGLIGLAGLGRKRKKDDTKNYQA